VLKGIAADYLRHATDAAEERANLDAVRLSLSGLRDRVVKEFPPPSVSIPPGTKNPPPDQPEGQAVPEKKVP
jgi:hypothetical protein